MGKADEFEKKAFKLAGAGWRNDLGLKGAYEQLKRLDEAEKLESQDEMIKKIKNLEVLVEESYAEDRDADVRAKMIEALEALRLKYVEGRKEKRQLNEEQFELLKELRAGIESWKKSLRGTDALLVILKTAIKDANEAREKARKAIEKADATNEKLTAETLRYNNLAIKLNKKYLELDKRISKYNARIKRLNRTRGT